MMIKGKKVLVTGATGFVGSCLAHKLIELGNEVHVFLRKSSNLWRINGVIDELKSHYVDLCDHKRVEQTIKEIKPEIIFHCAAYGTYPSQKESETIVKTDLFGTINLVNACAKTDFTRLINTGSSSEYGIKDHPMSEGDVLEPYSMYGVAKSSASIFCQHMAREHGLPIVTLRPFSVYGYYEEPSRFIPTVIVSCLQNRSPRIFSKNSVRDFVFIEDLIDAYLNASQVPSAIGQIINIGGGKQHTVAEVAEKIVELTGNQVKIIFDERETSRIEPKVWVADISKAKSLLNWKPKHDLKMGLSKTVQWFKQNLSLYVNRTP